jgi:hypothetical protein
MTDPRQLAASIVGAVDWQSEVSAFLPLSKRRHERSKTRFVSNWRQVMFRDRDDSKRFAPYKKTGPSDQGMTERPGEFR